MESNPAYAIWAVTEDGAALGRKIQQQLPGADLYLSGSEGQAGKAENRPPARTFERLSQGLSAVFSQYRGHICIMSAGIVVRSIAPLLRHKTVDPAVVVIDEGGRHVVSLLSGHIGGANALAQTLAQMIDATPVITTATDVHQLPAVDVIAVQLGLKIENVEAVKAIHMALLTGGKLRLHDPYDILGRRLPGRFIAAKLDLAKAAPGETAAQPGIFVDDRQVDLPADILILRPATLAAGIGCNRGTPMHEIRDHLLQVMAAHRLVPGSLISLASIQIKRDEPGLLAAAKELELPIRFYPPDQLERVDGVQNPSAVVAKHLGVSSVCEAAAILAADRGNLIVPKHATPNVTVAIARIAFTS
jgi:cobalt-precorrin 5A hydrolase